MFFQFQEDRRGGGGGVSAALSVEYLAFIRRHTYICIYELIYGRENVLMTRNVFEGIRTIFFNPANANQHLNCSSSSARRVPWKTVFGLNRQISCASLALRVGIVRIKNYLVACRWRINVHIIFVIRHLCGWGSCS